MSQVKHLAIATLAILVLVAVPAQSTQSLIFDQGFSAGLPVGIAGGFVWWTGNVNEGLHGQDIAFTSITILDSPVFGVGSSVSLTCDSCFLEFTTGKFKQITIGFHQFQNGGSFSLDGTVNNAGAIIPAYTGFTGNILSGQFQGSPKPVVSASSSLTGVFNRRRRRRKKLAPGRPFRIRAQF